MLDLCIFLSWFRRDEVKNVLMDLFITNTQLFASQDGNLPIGVMWITHELLWYFYVYVMFYVMFSAVWTDGLSFWRHPFTAEDPLVSKWFNATFFQNLFCGWNKLIYFWVNYSLEASHAWMFYYMNYSALI